MTLAELLKDWRRRGNLTQSEAAIALGLPLKTYQAIEQGRSFKYEQLVRLAVVTAIEHQRQTEVVA
jgi:DNA-binding XRE family transcriptional regulator